LQLRGEFDRLPPEAVPIIPIPGREAVILTEQQKDERAARLAEQAQARKQATEDAQIAEIRSVWDRIPADTRRIFDYIDGEIMRRESPEDVQFLRDTRALHFRPYRRYLKEPSS
jgi:hypothetical protein